MWMLCGVSSGRTALKSGSSERACSFAARLLSYYTSYAVARVWSGFCLRQHGTFHLLYAVFPRSARKNCILTEIKYRSAEGKKSRPRKSCHMTGLTQWGFGGGLPPPRSLIFARVGRLCRRTRAKEKEAWWGVWCPPPPSI